MDVAACLRLVGMESIISGLAQFSFTAKFFVLRLTNNESLSIHGVKSNYLYNFEAINIYLNQKSKKSMKAVLGLELCSIDPAFG